MVQIKILAPAKVNIHLQIGSKREDGYHNILSLMQMITLFDELSIKRIEEPETRVTGYFDCAPQDNLIFKASEWMREKNKINGGFEIVCNKRIPAGAGLGGGSSDAAAVLHGINYLEGLCADSTELNQAAIQLGSDVPFFLGTATALASGRGEDLLSVATREDLYLLLIDTGIHCSTREVFSKFNPGSGRECLSSESIVHAYLNLPPSDWPFFNTFTNYLYKRNDVYKTMIDLLNSNGSEYSSISGTGSSVFGVFSDKNMTSEAEKVLKKCNIKTQKLKMLANSPTAVYNYSTSQ